MCGIAGILWPGNSDEMQLKNIAARMISTLHHRGPDAQGIKVIPHSGLAFGHCRLSIQDLSPMGAQPMESATGRYVINYNGEVYNFQTLRKELIKKGHSFKGRSDTEIILASVEEWGLEKALTRFVGMFAFALWDNLEQKLYLTRDRLGEKPLYYGFLGKIIVFVSELKALHEIPGWAPSINRQALTLFMRYGYIPSPYSIYDGIYKLIPGTYITFPENFIAGTSSFSQFAEPQFKTNIQPVRYWSLADVAIVGRNNRVTDEQDAAREFDRLLHDSVKSQMIADVPFGAFLSGGIDSSAVTAYMQKIHDSPVKTFTIGFDNKEFNEAPYARAIAEILGTDHTEVYLTPKDTLAIVPRLPTIYDEPHADSSQIPAFLVSSIARRNVTVCLSGDGGDELFAGYNRYLRIEEIWMMSRLLPTSMRKTISKLILHIAPSNWDLVYRTIHRLSLRKTVRQTDVSLKIQKLAGILSMDSLPDMYKELLSYWNDPESVVLRGSEPDYIFNHDINFMKKQEFVNQALYWDSLFYLPDDNLCKVDRASMAVGLETRLPLLDHRIVEFVWRLPLNMKIRNKESKWLLRQVLYKYIDRKLLDRPKMGFSIPIAEWLRGPLRDWGEDLLAEKKLRNEGFFNPTIVRQKWDEHIKGKRNWHLALWAILTFQAWRR